MRPLVSYYGGKQMQVKNILPLTPECQTYVEPFAGSLAVLFARPPARGDQAEVINDLDDRLINLYRVMQDKDKSEDLIRRISWTPHSRAEYRRAKMVNEPLHTDSVTKAWMYYVNINQSFAKKLDGGWGYSLKKNEAKYFANKANPTNLYAIRDRLSRVQIECADALSVIDTWDSDDTLFYCDPPYPDTDCGHYKGYSHEDLKALIDKLSSIKGSFLLSNYAQDYLPSEWERFEFSAIASSRKVSTGQKRDADRTEVIWRKLNGKHRASIGRGVQMRLAI